MVVEKLRTCLKNNNISISTLSRKTGLEPDYLSDCLNGTAKLTASDFIVLCQALNLDLNDFTCDK